MLPWDHLAVGYVAYSLLARLGHTRPDDRAAIAVVIGTQFPDLVDKPLAWGIDVLPSGTSLAHSVLFAVPFACLVWLLARRRDAGPVGAAFGVGYLLHLPADLLFGPIVLNQPIEWGHFLWPLVAQSPAPLDGGFVATVSYFLVRYQTLVVSPRAVGYLLVEVALLVGAAALWVTDGSPGLGWLRRRSDHR